MVNSDGQIQIAAVCGSQRAGSYNAGLIRALQEIAQKRGTMVITPVDGLSDLPFASVEYYFGEVPDSVKHVHGQIGAADGVIIATPEFCYSLPAVLKNFFDWQTLPVPALNPLRHKPLGIIGASIGTIGTNRAQMDLRKIALYSDLEVMGRPEIYVNHAGEKFTQEGDLTDEGVRTLLERWLDDYEEFARSTIARDLASKNREYLVT
ncbi:NAD(P)H-dependent oxidoreductase [Microbacterium sp. LTA6]|uniref:NADPH-dependent FMN reductase n=1 Tax=unclassified Microbacterium TaxID=2609290 RepID=UPI00313897C1